MVTTLQQECRTCRYWKMEGLSAQRQTKACSVTKCTLPTDTCPKWKRRHCIGCEQPLVGWQQKKFCSHACSDRHNKKKIVTSPCTCCGTPIKTKKSGRNPGLCSGCKSKECENCGSLFLPSRREQRFCTFDCFLTPDVTCEECGGLFQARTHNAKRCDDCYEQYCSCGCGTRIAYPRDVKAYYAPGHWIKDPDNISPQTRAKWSKAYGGFAHTPNSLELRVLDRLDSSLFHYAGQKQVDLGQPISADIICSDVKLIILVDGCHWHECPLHGNGYFPNKPKKDKQLTKVAQDAGWEVLRFWEHQILEDINQIVNEIIHTRDSLLTSAGS